MAQVYPHSWQHSREIADQSVGRKLATLAKLATSLSNDYLIYHQFHWTNLSANPAALDPDEQQADFIILGPNGNLLLIDQKSGLLSVHNNRLRAKFGSKQRYVADHLARKATQLAEKLALKFNRINQNGVICPQVDSLLYCPDFTVSDPLSAALDHLRIVDNRQAEQLSENITRLLPPPLPGSNAEKSLRFSREFLQNIIELKADVSLMIGQAQTLVTRISGGLAHWARQLQFEPFRLHVIGTAGSGKTQLALAEFEDALAGGKKPLYVCYNRPLADHFARLSATGGMCLNFHQLCERLLQEHGEKINFSELGAFDRLVDHASALAITDNLIFNTIIIDEGQDIKQSWREQILRHLGTNGRLLLLEDPQQNLYQRDIPTLANWVSIRSQANYRSPRRILKEVNLLLPETEQIDAASPINGTTPQTYLYTTQEELLAACKSALRQQFAAGFKREDIALLSYHGRQNSMLTTIDRLGQYRLRRYSGAYDDNGNPLYSDGDIFHETIYRFKGQSAPAVIFSEIDFSELNKQEIAKLFAGMTRARVALSMVLTPMALALLHNRGLFAERASKDQDN